MLQKEEGGGRREVEVEGASLQGERRKRKKRTETGKKQPIKQEHIHANNKQQVANNASKSSEQNKISRHESYPMLRVVVVRVVVADDESGDDDMKMDAYEYRIKTD